MDWSVALPTFFVTLREGVEATLVVGIVLALLNKAGQSRLNSWVYAGVGGGLAASILVGGLLNWVTGIAAKSEYASVTKEILEGLFGVLAIAMLSWMLIWMTKQARVMKSQIEQTVNSSLTDTSHTGWGIFSLILVAVAREGFETVFFIAANFQAGMLPAVGAIAGLIGAVIIGILLFKLGVKIDIRKFFQIMGTILVFIVSGLVVSALYHFDQAVANLALANSKFASFCNPDLQSSCILSFQVWDTSNILPDKEFPGILFKSFLGYREHLYFVQAIAYLVFLFTVSTMYLRSFTDNRDNKVVTE
ncbi:FTR1 family iron permease [Calothrix sp. 336/3]|uniref:FTR1 family iron permease n=1 Tax=Calothrix sp. 336/3 TaxID=1337936 RepID=UPI0004E457F8|nr:FTR1 family protein [Calothrix sp. 336/3]AKG24667.1 membrane protein [Calothrix sp. 336/3]